VSNKHKRSGHDYVRFGKYGLVGALNTLIDFSIYNVLSGAFSFSLVQANIVSTTIAMIFSFVANKQLVFKSESGSWMRQGILFLLVTAFGLYVLQTGTIKLLTDVWLVPVNLGLIAAHGIGIKGHDHFLAKNGAKAIATAVSLTWNYIMYKKVVFS
jgi:putative flippase GtrA